MNKNAVGWLTNILRQSNTCIVKWLLHL